MAGSTGPGEYPSSRSAFAELKNIGSRASATSFAFTRRSAAAARTAA
jgi:hypothetical protein